LSETTYRPIPLPLTLLIGLFSALVALGFSGAHHHDHGHGHGHHDTAAATAVAVTSPLAQERRKTLGESGHKVDVKNEPRQEREHHELVAWRCDQLVDAGFPLALAVELAHDLRYDLHALCDLVERGCSTEIAVRILSPLDVAAA
jgi:hypothetical protein